MDPREHRSDKALAERAAAGDEHAWREIYTATREHLFGLLVYQLGSREEALDVLQETYLQAVRGIHAYEGRGSLESWLCGIALRRSLDWKRRIFRRRSKEEPSLDDAEELAGEAGSPEESRAIARALAELPDRQRSAVLLHEWFGYSFREIGELLGCGEGTARVHAFRGRELLGQLLGEAPSEAPAAPITPIPSARGAEAPSAARVREERP
jgi:RNA polymerase sigma-70 factor (ECF subfamily)